MVPRRVATFSLVARDPEAGELGVATQSKFPAVGSVVPWARASVGAVATQARANVTYGPRGLDLLAEGRTPQEALDALVAADDEASVRQVGMVDHRGRAAAFTGADCQAWAGHVVGDGYAALGNILASRRVVDAMAAGFEAGEGSLVERLLDALEAGQAAGGDRRGQQAAALLVVREGGGYGGLTDRYLDLRVDDHAAPIRELRRIHDVYRGEVLGGC